MGWELAAGLNGLIAACYLAITGLILMGLSRTKQMTKNPLALATATIFFTCAAHHGHHAAHLVSAFGDQEAPADLAAVRAVFGEWHSVAIDAVGAVVAGVYLGLRRNYKALLNTPQMFDDRVRVAAEQALHGLAFTDSLTAIPNRAAYQALADDLADDDRAAAVLFLDLDGFKSINDRLGHDAGDRVLRHVAQAIARTLREDEYVFRLGGDELLVIGLGHSAVAVQLLRTRVQAAVAEPVPTREEPLSVEASCGTALGRAAEVEALLRAADQDMYRIKADRGSVASHPRSIVPLPATGS